MNFGCCFFSGGLLCAARAKWVHNLALPCLCSAQKCAHPCTHGAHGACYAQSTRAAYEACFKSASLFVYFGLIRAEELLSSGGDLGIHLFSVCFWIFFLILSTVSFFFFPFCRCNEVELCVCKGAKNGNWLTFKCPEGFSIWQRSIRSD